ncbi:IS30 family transposase [Faecalimonas sp.]
MELQHNICQGRAITMDCQNYIIESAERKKSQHLQRGEAVYRANRHRSRRQHRIVCCPQFLRWVITQFHEHKWSLDACVGYARLHRLFPEGEMVCTHTLYNEIWAGNLDLSVTELPEAMKRKRHKGSKSHKNKKRYGKSISERPEIAALRTDEGHWEGDTVVGKKAGKEAVILSLLEKKTEHYIAIQIPGKDSASVLHAMQSLRNEYGEKFAQVFKTITVDNGSEFSRSAQIENWGSQIYFAHPYTSWERSHNERHNGLFWAFVPKGVSIELFSPEYILSAADSRII